MSKINKFVNIVLDNKFFIFAFASFVLFSISIFTEDMFYAIIFNTTMWGFLILYVLFQIKSKIDKCFKFKMPTCTDFSKIINELNKKPKED